MPLLKLKKKTESKVFLSLEKHCSLKNKTCFSIYYHKNKNRAISNIHQFLLNLKTPSINRKKPKPALINRKLSKSGPQ
jgi:hypothetical protein